MKLKFYQENSTKNTQEFTSKFVIFITSIQFAFITSLELWFQLGTIVSAHGCWRCFNKPLIHNGAKAEFLRRDVEETMSTNLIASNKLESQYVEEDFQQRAGFWGFVMQTIYQVSQTLRIQCFCWKIRMRYLMMVLIQLPWPKCVSKQLSLS